MKNGKPPNNEDMDKLTEFSRAQGDDAEEDSGGGVSGFFGRWFRTSPPIRKSPQPPSDDFPTSSAASVVVRKNSDLSSDGDSEQKGRNVIRPLARTNSINSVRRRLSSVLLGRSDNPVKDPETGKVLLDYNSSDYRQYWMPDYRGKECYECQEKFTTLRRRHHCRICGQIFCARCCNQEIPGRLLGYMGNLRLCNYCSKSVSDYLEQESGSEAASDTSRPSLASVQDSQSSISYISAGLNAIPTSNSVVRSSSGVSLLSYQRANAWPPGVQESGRPTTLSVQELVIPDTLSSGVEDPSPTEAFEPDWVRSIEVNYINDGSFESERIRRSHSISVDMDTEDGRYQLSPAKSQRSSASPMSINIPNNQESTPIAHSMPARSLMAPPCSPVSPQPSMERRSDNGSVCSGHDSHPDFRHTFQTHCISVLEYLLLREHLDVKIWTTVLWPIIKKAASSVIPNIPDRKDDMDILSYIHVKTLVDSEEPDAQIIFGTVCSKTLADSRMKQSLISPEILVVAGSVEYERVGGKFSSIDPIILQEYEYLRNVVHKVASRQPNLVVVEKSVARVAQQLLLLNNIGLVCNLKSAVLKRVARCTQADVTPSIEGQIIKPRLGTCGSFVAETFTLLNGDTKTLLFFKGSTPNLGCAIIIRGADLRELRRAKRIVKFMISIVYSGKLEMSMLDLCRVCLTESGDQGPSVNSNCVICSKNQNLVATQKSTEDEEETFEMAMSSAKLTGSSLITYAMPYLETREGLVSPHLPYFKRPLYPFRRRSDIESPLFNSPEHLPKKKKVDLEREEETLHEFLSMKLTEDAGSEGVRDSVAAFRAQNGGLFRERWMQAFRKDPNNYKQPAPGRPAPLSPRERKKVRCPSGPLDVLSAYHHLRLAVLFCSYSSKSENAPGFCIDPWVVWMEFYGRHDLPLGDFLQRYCFNPSYMCPKREGKHCEVSMLEHTRKIVHRNACVEITSQSIMEETKEKVDGETQILMWNWCGECKASTPAAPMSSEMWHLSFAKYLDYLFNGVSLSSHVSGAGADSVCSHCLFHHHHHHFAFSNYVATFKVSEVELYDVGFSPMTCQMNPTIVPVISLVEQSKQLSEKAGSVFSSMLEQTCNLKTHPEGMQKYAGNLADLLAIYEQGQEAFRDRLAGLQETLTALSPLSSRQIATNDVTYLRVADGLTRCRQILTSAILQWNTAVSEIQSVKSSRKLTPRDPQMISDMERVKSMPILDMSAGESAAHIQSIPSVSAIVSEQFSHVEGPENKMQLLQVNNGPSSEMGSTRRLEETDAELRKSSAKIPLSLFTLTTPFRASDHYSLPVGRIPVVVRDGEIGSIIAYSISSMDYEQKKKELRESLGAEGVSIGLKHPSVQEGTGTGNKSVDANSASNNQHIELQFADSTSKYYCKVYYAEQFAMLRKLLVADGEDAFIRSVGRTDSWTPKGGKSGASFYRTKDKRFIIKTMSRFEIASFLNFAPHYFNYICTAATENKLTALAKIYGVYRVCYKNDVTKEQAKKDIFVMEYLFYGKNVTQVYDLKGSLRNRWASEKGGEVELDENLLKKAWSNPQYLHPHSRTVLTMAIQNDSHFLSSHSVMDYSLLVGVEEECGRLLVGVIDYIRTYTLDKKLEYWVKSVAVPGQLPTVISPEMYCTRFSEAIDIYFPVSPDQWTGLGHGMLP